MSDAVARLATAVGIAPEYRDVTGTLRRTSSESAMALLAAMGFAAETDAQAAASLAELQAEAAARPLPQWCVTAVNTPIRLDVAGVADHWHLVLEDGSELDGVARDGIHLPQLPLGHHRLHCRGFTTTILCAPDRLALPERGWGITLPLYGLRTDAEGGFGDFHDLAAAIEGLGAIGAGFVGINPIPAGFVGDPFAFSPYSPSSRQRLNIAHIAVPGAGGTGGSLIDYARDLPAKMAALEAAFAALGDAEMAAFEAFRITRGSALERFATHQALAERFGAYWNHWPDAYQRPDTPEVAAFAIGASERIRFHAWAQFMAESQLREVRDAAARAGMAHGLYLDLAVGTHPYGAETWGEPESFARGVSLGAPPDAFASEGQTWGLAPFNPRSLAATGFRALAETLREQFRFARMLRIDHILGFDRAFWVPEGSGIPGAYVTMPRAAMLAVTRIEAARAGAVVIGEDLGNVPDGLRADLDASGIFGCRVTMFERTSDDPPRYRDSSDYDRDTLAAFGTHDLPTWAGWRIGRDIDWRERLGRMDAQTAAAARAGRWADVGALDSVIATGWLADDLHRFLGRSTAQLVALQAEDIFGLEEQPNLPGTIYDHPNWRRRLPVSASAIGSDPRVLSAARAVRR